MSVTKVLPNSELAKASFVLRSLDKVDRAHARAATVLHGVRNTVRERVEQVLERAEKLTLKGFERAREGVKRADHVSADAVNRAQGALGHALEVARESRSKHDQLPS